MRQHLNTALSAVVAGLFWFEGVPRFLHYALQGVVTMPPGASFVDSLVPRWMSAVLWVSTWCSRGLGAAAVISASVAAASTIVQSARGSAESKAKAPRMVDAPKSEPVVTMTGLTPLFRNAASWLDRQRELTPAPALRLLGSIQSRIAELAQQLHEADHATQTTAETMLQPLLAHELPALVDPYLRMPPSERDRPAVYGTASELLIKSLETVERKLMSMQAELADVERKRLATQQRFLELKYDGAVEELKPPQEQ